MTLPGVNVNPRSLWNGRAARAPVPVEAVSPHPPVAPMLPWAPGALHARLGFRQKDTSRCRQIDHVSHEGLRHWANVHEYGDQAIRYLEIARISDDPDAQNRFIQIAQHYGTLADAEERDAESKRVERRSGSSDKIQREETVSTAYVALARDAKPLPAAQPNTLYEALPSLPLAPTLSPALAFKVEADATATSDTSVENEETEIVKTLEAIPTGSAITFAISSLGVLCLAGTPIVRGTEAYGKVERLAQASDCSCSLHENAGTITFYRR